jgi:hypothetical protein
MALFSHRNDSQPRSFYDVVVVGVVVAVPTCGVDVDSGDHGPHGSLQHGQAPSYGVIQPAEEEKRGGKLIKHSFLSRNVVNG